MKISLKEIYEIFDTLENKHYQLFREDFVVGPRIRCLLPYDVIDLPFVKSIGILNPWWAPYEKGYIIANGIRLNYFIYRRDIVHDLLKNSRTPKREFISLFDDSNQGYTVDNIQYWVELDEDELIEIIQNQILNFLEEVVKMNLESEILEIEEDFDLNLYYHSRLKSMIKNSIDYNYGEYEEDDYITEEIPDFEEDELFYMENLDAEDDECEEYEY